MKSSAYSREIKIALTTIIAIVIIYLGIMFLKGIKLAKTDNVYVVVMEDVNGLALQAPVLSNGLEIGVVKRLAFNQQTRHVEAAIELSKGYSVPRGTTATLSKDMLGAPKLKLLPGSGAEGYLSQGDTIYGVPMVDLMETAGDLLPTLSSILLRADSILATLNNLVATPALPQTLDNLQYASNNLRSTTDQLNDMLVSDMQPLMAQVNAIGANLQQTTGQLAGVDIAAMATSAQGTIDNLQHFTDRLNSNEGSLGKLMADPSLYNNLDSTMLNASRLLEDLRLHPKRYVHFSLFGKKDK